MFLKKINFKHLLLFADAPYSRVALLTINTFQRASKEPSFLRGTQGLQLLWLFSLPLGTHTGTAYILSEKKLNFGFTMWIAPPTKEWKWHSLQIVCFRKPKICVKTEWICSAQKEGTERAGKVWMPVIYKVSSNGTLLLLLLSLIISNSNHCWYGFVLREYLRTAFVLYSSSLMQEVHFSGQKRADEYIWPDRALRGVSGTTVFKHEKQWYSPDLTTVFPQSLWKRRILREDLKVGMELIGKVFKAVPRSDGKHGGN